MPRHEGSYYAATASEPVGATPLAGRVDARVVVVGGGFAGLATALGLAERGVRDVVLLEAHDIGHGASGRNGGFAFGGFSRSEQKLADELGPQLARRLYRGTVDAVALIRERCRRYGIDADVNDAGVLWTNWFRDPEVLRGRQRLLREVYGIDWEWVDAADLRTMLLTDRYHDALWERAALHLHPLRYARGIARAAMSLGVRVHERSPATALERDGQGWRIRTPDGELHAQTVVLACGGYLAGLRPDLDAAVLPIATYVMATEPLGDRLREAMRTDAAVYDTRFAFDYYRPLPDTRLLWGGRIHVRDLPARDVERVLVRDLLRVFPQLDGVAVDYAWSGLMGYSRHEMPHVGEIEPGLWQVQAFGGHGVAPTTFGGETIAKAIVQGDMGWRDFARYPVRSAVKPLGFAAAQLTYWWLQCRDAWKDWAERRMH